MRVGAFRMCVSETHHVFWRCRSPVSIKSYLHNILETLKHIGILERHVLKNAKNVKLNNKKSKAVKICFFMAFVLSKFFNKWSVFLKSEVLKKFKISRILTF